MQTRTMRVLSKSKVLLGGTALLLLPKGAMASPAPLALQAGSAMGTLWWVWPLGLFALTFALGFLGVLAGVGGGCLFVPIVGGFFPFHLDFVRATGLLMAMSGPLAAGPSLLKMDMANLRLVMPIGLVASVGAILGAMVGLSLPADVVETALGVAIIGIVIIMIRARRSAFPHVPRADRLSQILGIQGSYSEVGLDQPKRWRTHRMVTGLLLFAGVGFVGGLFGLGAGWANVPVLNLVMGVPLKVSVATGGFLLSITGTSASWVYLNRGCVLPLMAVPAILGAMIGARLGVRVLRVAKPGIVRWLLIAILLFAGAKAFTEGLGLPFIV